MNTTGIILAGHGSHLLPSTAGLVWKQVDALRRLNIVDEVTAAFWKEQPSFHTVLRSMRAEDITIMPVFTARGYFTEMVIPAEMGIVYPVSTVDGQVLRYARPLSEHPYLSEVTLRRISRTILRAAVPPEQIGIVVIGHSTRRYPASRLATEAQANAIRELGIAREVVAVYLDDSPSVTDAYALTSCPVLICVPYFLAMGSHATIDVPIQLGLQGLESPQKIGDRTVFYTSPVGIDDDLTAVLLSLIRDTGIALREPASLQQQSDWSGIPNYGESVLADMMDRPSEVRIGQLRITRQDIRHSLDEREEANSLKILSSPAEVRELCRNSPFRPLATSNDLPRGWQVRLNDLDSAYRPSVRANAVIETIYPGVLAEWARQHYRIFAPNSLDALVARQVGDYHRLTQATESVVESLMQEVCTNCVCEPSWAKTQITSPVTPANGVKLPCYEPCNWWLSEGLRRLS